MKKLLVTLLVFTLVTTFLPCLSEHIDLDSMSYDELVGLEFEVLEKLYTYDSTSFNFYYPGTYVVGEDIEEGSYLFKGVDFGPNGDVSGILRVWPDIESMRAIDYSKLNFGEMVSEGYNIPLQCNLKNGMCLTLEGAVFSAVRR